MGGERCAHGRGAAAHGPRVLQRRCRQRARVQLLHGHRARLHRRGRGTVYQRRHHHAHAAVRLCHRVGGLQHPAQQADHLLHRGRARPVVAVLPVRAVGGGHHRRRVSAAGGVRHAGGVRGGVRVREPGLLCAGRERDGHGWHGILHKPRSQVPRPRQLPVLPLHHR